MSGHRASTGPLLLAVESSCDETAIALVEGGRRIRANVVASQVALHAATGGIVPEVAARAHLRWIVPVLEAAWSDAGVGWEDVDAVAVTYGPGLAGSLLVGVNFAKALAHVRGKPLVGVNHLEGHVEAGWLIDPGEDPAARPEPPFPLVALVVSGGHTFLVEMRDHGDYRLLGQTVDDAAGEAFDKVGRLLGLGYPGGPAIQQAAEGARRHDARFPRAWLGETYDFSFSGLKTAARRIVAAARAEEGLPAVVGPAGDEPSARLSDATIAELAWGFQDAVVDVLATKTMRAARETGARAIVVGGGVAANAALRARLEADAAELGLPVVVPRPGLCTDNGAMIGAAGARRFAAGERAGLDLDARPSLPLAVR
jgi:tRNA N6-adenosine threonylcarbamoyltransferase